MPNEQWIMAAFKISPSPDANQLVMGLRSRRARPRHNPLNRRPQTLLAIVGTVREATVRAANASRCRRSPGPARALHTSIVIGAIGKAVRLRRTVHLDSFSINSWRRAPPFTGPRVRER
jgi:hypothetical protein